MYYSITPDEKWIFVNFSWESTTFWRYYEKNQYITLWIWIYMCVYCWITYPTMRWLSKSHENKFKKLQTYPLPTQCGYKCEILKKSFHHAQGEKEYLGFWVTHKYIKPLKKNKTLLEMKKNQYGICRIKEIALICML